jgi:hypothetical protein
MTNEFGDNDSGPFCRHWSDPSDCELKCNNCGHWCGQHRANDGKAPCYFSDLKYCECKDWAEDGVIGETE